MCLFSNFQYGFRSSWSTADLNCRIAMAFNRSGATWAAALDISRAFYKVWHAGLLYKLKSYGISGLIFGLISSFLSNRWLWVDVDGKSSQEYPVNAGVPQGCILGPILNDLLDDVSVILLSMLMMLLSKVQPGIWSVATTRVGFWTWIWSTRFCGLGQEVASAIDLKVDWSVSWAKIIFKILGLNFTSKLDYVYILHYLCC